MAISGNYSYIPVTDEFLAHWQAVNTALGLPGLVLAGAFDREALVTLRDSLVTANTTIQAKLNDREVARGDIEVKKAALRDRFDQFTARIRGLYPGTKWIEALPLAPTLSEGDGKFLPPMDDAAELWERIDNTITLPGAYGFDAFNDDIADLRTAVSDYAGAVLGLKLAREERDDIQEKSAPVWSATGKRCPVSSRKAMP